MGDQELHPISGVDQESHPIDRGDKESHPISRGDWDLEGRSRWEKATIAFTFLKQKIATTPILKHFDPDRRPVIVVYASKWSVLTAHLFKSYAEAQRS